MKTSTKRRCANMVLATLALIMTISCVAPLMEEHGLSQPTGGSQVSDGILVHIGMLNQAEAISARGRSNTIRHCCEYACEHAIVLNPIDEKSVNLEIHLLGNNREILFTTNHTMYSLDQTVFVNGERFPVLAASGSDTQNLNWENALIFLPRPDLTHNADLPNVPVADWDTGGFVALCGGVANGSRWIWCISVVCPRPDDRDHDQGDRDRDQGDQDRDQGDQDRDQGDQDRDQKEDPEEQSLRPGMGFPGTGFPGGGFPGIEIPGTGFPGGGFPGIEIPETGFPGGEFPGGSIP